MHTLKTGSRAYFDSMGGLVPVRILSITAPTTTPTFDLTLGGVSTSVMVRAQITEDSGPYKEGEVIATPATYVFPTSALKKVGYSLFVQPYEVIGD